MRREVLTSQEDTGRRGILTNPVELFGKMCEKTNISNRASKHESQIHHWAKRRTQEESAQERNNRRDIHTERGQRGTCRKTQNLSKLCYPSVGDKNHSSLHHCTSLSIPKCYALIPMSLELLCVSPPPTLTMKIPTAYSNGSVGGDSDSWWFWWWFHLNIHRALPSRGWPAYSSAMDVEICPILYRQPSIKYFTHNHLTGKLWAGYLPSSDSFSASIKKRLQHHPYLVGLL